MKNVIFINGTMGVGKSATCRELQKRLPRNVWLDGDWCWLMEPFVVTEETKAMVMDNITHLLGNFIRCSQYENILFCWVMHQQRILDDVLARLDLTGCRVHLFTLTADETALRQRLNRDIARGVREPDVVERSLARLPLYAELNTEKIDVGALSAAEAARLIAGWVTGIAAPGERR